MTLSVDNYGGARKAVEYLLSLGRRKVGLINGPLEWLEARQRMQGWEDALVNAGICVSPQHWTSGNWSSASGEVAFAELIEKYPDLDAVFASNDQMALGAIHYAGAHGLRIPADFAIVGFDDLTEAAHFTPALTTITHPLRELGILAVTTLLDQIEDINALPSVRTLTLQTELVVRDSTPRSAA